jgi:hypothetical protein
MSILLVLSLVLLRASAGEISLNGEWVGEEQISPNLIEFASPRMWEDIFIGTVDEERQVELANHGLTATLIEPGTDLTMSMLWAIAYSDSVVGPFGENGTIEERNSTMCPYIEYFYAQLVDNPNPTRYNLPVETYWYIYPKSYYADRFHSQPCASGKPIPGEVVRDRYGITQRGVMSDSWTRLNEHFRWVAMDGDNGRWVHRNHLNLTGIPTHPPYPYGEIVYVTDCTPAGNNYTPMCTRVTRCSFITSGPVEVPFDPTRGDTYSCNRRHFRDRCPSEDNVMYMATLDFDSSFFTFHPPSNQQQFDTLRGRTLSSAKHIFPLKMTAVLQEMIEAHRV